MNDWPEVVGVPGIGYLVTSKSHDGYFVIVHENTCTCPAGAHGAKTCRHRRLVAEAVAEINKRKARPVAPPAISQLVD